MSPRPRLASDSMEELESDLITRRSECLPAGSRETDLAENLPSSIECH
jgi:hypothetical protein